MIGFTAPYLVTTVDPSTIGKISLYSLRDTSGPAPKLPTGNLVQFINKYYSQLFSPRNGLRDNLLHINQLLRLFLPEDLARLFNRGFLLFCGKE